MEMVVREIKDTQEKQKQKIQKENTFCIHKDTRQNRKKGHIHIYIYKQHTYKHKNKKKHDLLNDQ